MINGDDFTSKRSLLYEKFKMIVANNGYEGILSADAAEYDEASLSTKIPDYYC